MNVIFTLWFEKIGNKLNFLGYTFMNNKLAPLTVYTQYPVIMNFRQPS